MSRIQSGLAGDFLQGCERTGVLQFFPDGRKLRSGRESPYFIDIGNGSCGHKISFLAYYYAQKIRDLGEDIWSEAVLFGPAYKGIPLVAVIAQKLWDYHEINIDFAFNRKEPKDHGEGGMVVGTPLSGRKIILVDDVITDGKRLQIRVIVGR